MAFPRARDASRCRAFQRRFVSKRRGLGTHNTERVTRAAPLCPARGTRTMPKKDKAKAKQQAEDARGAVTEEVSKTVDDAQHAAGGVTSSLKDAVETVAETTTHVLRHPPVSSAIDKVCLPFPRARAILAALPPSTLTRRPSSPCPRNARRDDVFTFTGIFEPPAERGGARREQRRKGGRARRRRSRPTMLAGQVHHLVRRLRRLFSVRSTEELFPTFAVRPRRERRSFSTRNARRANAFGGAPPRSPARTDAHHRHLVEARCDSSAFRLCSKTLAAT